METRRIEDGLNVDFEAAGHAVGIDGASRRLDLTKLISHRFPLEQAAEAIRLASNPVADSMKIVLKP